MTFDNGVIKDGVYSNECLGFSFQIPEGWETVPRNDANGRARRDGDGLALLGLRVPKGGRVFMGSIWLRATPATGKASNAQDFVFSQVEKVMTAPAGSPELIANAYPVECSGRLFYRAEYKHPGGNLGTTYSTSIYTRFRGFFIGETITAGSLKDLDQAADSLGGISFRKDQVNPKCVMGPAEKQIFGRVGGGIGSSMK